MQDKNRLHLLRPHLTPIHLCFLTKSLWLYEFSCLCHRQARKQAREKPKIKTKPTSPTFLWLWLIPPASGLASLANFPNFAFQMNYIYLFIWSDYLSKKITPLQQLPAPAKTWASPFYHLPAMWDNKRFSSHSEYSLMRAISAGLVRCLLGEQEMI